MGRRLGYRGALGIGRGSARVSHSRFICQGAAVLVNGVAYGDECHPSDCGAAALLGRAGGALRLLTGCGDEAFPYEDGDSGQGASGFV